MQIYQIAAASLYTPDRRGWCARYDTTFKQVSAALFSVGIIAKEINPTDSPKAIQRYEGGTEEVLSLMHGHAIVDVQTENVSDRKLDVECVKITLDNGDFVVLGHYQDCCEDFSLVDGAAELKDLVGQTVYKTEVVCNARNETDWGSETYTFVNIQGSKTPCQLRFLGSSNCFYSEECHAVYCFKDAANYYVPVLPPAKLRQSVRPTQTHTDETVRLTMYDLWCSIVPVESWYAGYVYIPKDVFSKLPDGFVQNLRVHGGITLNEPEGDYHCLGFDTGHYSDKHNPKSFQFVYEQLDLLAMQIGLIRDSARVPNVRITPRDPKHCTIDQLLLMLMEVLYTDELEVELGQLAYWGYVLNFDDPHLYHEFYDMHPHDVSYVTFNDGSFCATVKMYSGQTASATASTKDEAVWRAALAALYPSYEFNAENYKAYFGADAL